VHIDRTSIPQSIMPGIRYREDLLILTASADSIAIDSGCWETQSSGVASSRKFVTAGREDNRHWLSSVLK
jgi:hypothetical protein